MTSETSTAWESALRDQVRIIAGAWADEVAEAWTTFAAEPLVRITLHGGYDTGKTSLIKRFLVEDCTPLPEGLLVGAMPTSFQAQRITSGGVVWVDTPGTDSGNTEHDAVAEEALILTDAVLIVLSPQLLSGDQDVVRGLIDGTFHNSVVGVPMFAEGALVVAVSQMDTAGVSPWDDKAAYQRLVARKRAELIGALGAGAGVVEGHLHFVAADPEEAGRTEAPGPDDYAGREDWDGVVELRADLAPLASRLTELRRGASVRYWSWVGERARQRATAELDRLDRVVEEAHRSEEVTDLLLEELDDVDRNARGKLRQAVYDNLLSGMTLSEDPATGRGEVERSLDATIGAWLAEWSGKLDGLARRAETELRVRAERPGAAVLQGYLDDLFATDLPPVTTTRPSVDDLLKRLDGHARTVARASYKLFHGMSAEEARAELTRLRYLRAEQWQQHFASADSLLTSAEHAHQISTSLQRVEAVEAVLPIALELTGYVVGGMLDKRADQRAATLRAELRGRADEIAEAIVSGGSGARSWADAVTALRERLDSGEGSPDLSSAPEERREAITAAVVELVALLGRATI